MVFSPVSCLSILKLLSRRQDLLGGKVGYGGKGSGSWEDGSFLMVRVCGECG